MSSGRAVRFMMMPPRHDSQKDLDAKDAEDDMQDTLESVTSSKYTPGDTVENFTVDEALDNGATMFAVNKSTKEGYNRYLPKAFTNVLPEGSSSPRVFDKSKHQSERAVEAHRSTETRNAISSLASLAASEGTASTGYSSTSARQTPRRSSIGSVTAVELQELFANGAVGYAPQHMNLGRIVHHVFRFLNPKEQANIKTGTFVKSAASLENTRAFVDQAFKRASSIAKKIINHWVFMGCSLTLTLYALFGPDCVTAFASKDIDFGFTVFNTCVFFIFAIEVVLMLLGRPDYVFVPLILDVIALLSILGDTWFLSGGTSSDAPDRMAVARSSRLTKITRVVRIARVTRLVPYMMKLFGRTSVEFAKSLLCRQLWRVCLFLDTDHDSYLSAFDLKCFYVVILQELRQYRDIHCRAMLSNDMQLLNEVAPPEEECISNLDFNSFIANFTATEAGQRLLQLLTVDIEQEAGVWTLTSRISDNVAVKICIGIVLLAIIMELLSPNIQDVSSEQFLAQLDEYAVYEHTLAVQLGSTGGYVELCASVQHFMNTFKVLFLYLDGRTYVDLGDCVPQGLPIAKDPLDYITDIITDKKLRVSEVLQLCYPFREVCQAGHARSVSLIDIRSKAQDYARWTILQTFCLIVLLLIFVLAFNHFLGSFTNTLLKPLRVLVDDMIALSSLELLQLDTDDKEPFAVKVADEIKYLQQAFQHMNQAIKAWSLYVPPAVVQCLLHAGMEATIGMTRVDVTVLFCDIANFDDAIGHLSPHDVLRELTEVLGKIADVIEEKGGTLLEFIGDEVMAVFNAPNILSNHPQAGALSALEIHRAVARIPPIPGEDGCEVTVKCRIGVHSAAILAGNLGSSMRMKYGLLGDGVNLSARLKGLNSKYGTQTLATRKVLGASSDSNAARDDYVISRPVDLVAVKGRKEPTVVHEILCPRVDQTTSGIEELASRHAEAFRLYHARNFRDALQIFTEVARSFEEGYGVRDEPSRQLALRCHAYIAEPPPDDWDGVERLKAKIFQVADAPLPDLSSTHIEKAPESSQAEERCLSGSLPADGSRTPTETRNVHSLPRHESMDLPGFIE